MIHQSFRLSCDSCNRREAKDEGESAAETRRFAQFHGWSRRLVQNGNAWDICPNCISEFENLPVVEIGE